MLFIKKNILIISYSYPPSNAPAAQRPFSIAKYIDKEKFNVTVITCSNPESSLGFDDKYSNILEGVKIISIKDLINSTTITTFRKNNNIEQNKNLKTTFKGAIFKVLNYMIIPDRVLFWYINVIRYLNKNTSLINETNIVLSTSPAFSNHLIAKFIKKKNKSIKWIADFRDFHFLKTTENKKDLKSLINQNLENSIIKKSDIITFISQSMKNVYSEHFNSSMNKMFTIYNGFDNEDLDTSNINNTQNSKLSIFYSGSFYSGLRSPKPLLEIIDKLFERQIISENKIEINIVGNFENQLKSEISNFKSFKCINFIGRLNRNEVLKKQLEADLLWLIVGEKITHYTGLPLKFFEYINTRRPIINFAPIISEPSTIINKYNLGWNIDPEKHSFDYQIQVFREIVNKYNDGSLKNPIKQNKFEEFNRKYQTKQFEDLITKIN